MSTQQPIEPQVSSLLEADGDNICLQRENSPAQSQPCGEATADAVVFAGRSVEPSAGGTYYVGADAHLYDRGERLDAIWPDEARNMVIVIDGSRPLYGEPPPRLVRPAPRPPAKTAHDAERLRRAELKRARKAAALAKQGDAA